jgi:hypothetical protein
MENPVIADDRQFMPFYTYMTKRSYTYILYLTGF